MKKKIFVCLLIIILLILFAIIYFLFFSNKEITGNRFNDCYLDNLSKLIKNKEEDNSINLKYLKFNNNELFFDEINNTYYYSLVENDSNKFNPIILINEDYTVNFSKYKIDDNTLKNNSVIKVLVSNEDSYKYFDLVCTTLPLININYDGKLSKNDKVKMEFKLFDNSNGKVINSNGKVHYRGHASLSYDKKNFKISLKDDNDDDNEISLLGMREDDDWVLYSAFSDSTKVRNVFSSNLWYKTTTSNNLKNGNEYKYVELFLNGEYNGLYALGYKPEGKELDASSDEYVFFKDNLKLPEIDSSLKYEDSYSISNDVDDEEKGYKLLKEYFTKLYKTQDYDEIIDMINLDNCLDYYIFIILIQGLDQVNSNTMLTFKKYGNDYKAVYTAWDNDYTWGAIYKIDALNQVVDAYDYKTNPVLFLNPIYFLSLLDEDRTNEMIKERYQELRKDLWSDDDLLDMLDSYEDDVFGSGAYIRDKKIWVNGNYMDDDKTDLTFFKEYVLKRTKYLDDYYKNL